MSKVKVGDKLLFRNGRIGGIFIEVIPVERITESGRIICGRYTLNPDLTIRGKRDSWHGPYYGEVVSEGELSRILAEQQEMSERRRLLTELRSISWGEKSTAELRQIHDVVQGQVKTKQGEG